jgi:uncharacterized protein YjbJ (UPF0337 family)
VETKAASVELNTVQSSLKEAITQKQQAEGLYKTAVSALERAEAEFMRKKGEADYAFSQAQHKFEKERDSNLQKVKDTYAKNVKDILEAVSK